MATVMTWGNSEGTKGRCDAKCHGASSSVCSCMCGGRYHGSALREGGVEQTMREHEADICHEAEARAKAAGFEIEFHGIQQVLAFMEKKRTALNRRQERFSW